VQRGFAFAAFLLGILAVLGWQYVRQHRDADGDIALSARTMLQSVEKQNALVSFAAQVVVVSTAQTPDTAWLGGKLTLIVPGTVRYGVDLSTLDAQAVSFDRATKQLTVRIKDVDVLSVEPDLTRLQEFNDITIGKLTQADVSLRNQAQTRIPALMRAQAQTPALTSLARNAARAQLRALLETTLQVTDPAIRVDVQVGPGKPS
jgi:Protein of unknown function (DUF4230)